MNKKGFLFMVIHPKHVSFTYYFNRKTSTGSNPHTGSVASIFEQVQSFVKSFNPKDYQIRTN